jgi:4-hydroxy-3-methylbut-2-enyl diphosphate reductase
MGVVTRVVDYGAFIDLGGVSGLLHIAEMSRSVLRSPYDVLVKGEAVSVVVLAVDVANERVRFRLEPLRDDGPLVPALDSALAA